LAIVADLHIHSPYSRATSKDLCPETLWVSAQLKGVGLLGTGDFTHPEWLRELEEKLEPADGGLLRLKPEYARSLETSVPASCRREVRFVFQTEISTIYKKGGRTRKVHHLVLLPDSASVMRFISSLERVGNLRSDGRPILGLDSRDLLELALEASPEAIFIPAHIWTPWFSVLGSRSGFDDLQECYGDLTSHIAALETGLSSDPAMNWRCSFLDRFPLVSNSDAHSPTRLGREATVLEIPLSYEALRGALVSGDGLLGTIEFFPEEGKYHLDGHRGCGTRLEPAQTRDLEGACPRCGQPVTVGVMHRVEDLADRPPGYVPQGAKPFQRLLALEEILGEILGCGPSSRRVQLMHRRLIQSWGPEIELLRSLPVEEAEKAGIPMLAEALSRMRQGRICVEAGFDGQYGRIRLFHEEERASFHGQASLAMEIPPDRREPPTKTAQSHLRLSGKWGQPDPPDIRTAVAEPQGSADPLGALSLAQRQAVLHEGGPLVILAGPGSGKTLTLTHRIAHLIRCGKASPEEVLAVAFTQRAAQEMRHRLVALLERDGRPSQELRVQTLHAFGFDFLRRHWGEMGWEGTPFLVDETARMRILIEALQRECPGVSARALPSLMEEVSRWRQSPRQEGPPRSLVAQAAQAYERALRRCGALDYDDLLLLPLDILETREDILRESRLRNRFIFVDEFQDMNPLQVRLLKRLAHSGDGLTVIGDPDQSIYGFRGAKMENFSDLQRDFPQATILRLAENHRSTGTIVEASLGVISRNPSPFARSLVPLRESGARIRCALFETEREEAIFVAQEINRILGGTSHWAMESRGREHAREALQLGLSDLAVLYRLHALGGAVEDALLREGIPYQRYGGAELTGHPPIASLLAALRWLSDPRRDEDLLALLAAPSAGLSPATIAALRDSLGGNLWEGLAGDIPIRGLEAGEQARLRGLILSLGNLLRERDRLPVGRIVNRLLAALRLPVPRPTSLWEPAAEALRRLVSVAQGWGSDLVSFLDQWSLSKDADLYDPRSERVSLLSAHAAKGMEFSVVFLIGCEEGIFPLDPGGAGGDIEEERRLFFVSMTRAKDILYLTRARSRNLHGRRLEAGPSRFLAEIPEGLCDSEGQRDRRARPRPARQLKLF
jgi:DNA helicase-2/ATP-dependent DNA helicase PcrA